jgi:hypothetical protein
VSTERNDHPSDDRPGDDHGPGHDTERRERPARRSRLTVAAVATAVLLAGGGGAYWATSSGGTGGDSKASQPLRFDGPDAAAAAPGSSDPSAGGGTYQLTGTLPQGPKTAAVYRTAGGPDQAAVTRLARLLGLTAPVESVQGSWQVGGSADGGGPTLLVGKDAPGTWSYTRYGAPTASSGAASSGSSSTSTSNVPSSGTTITDAPGPVSVQKAQAVAAPVLAGLGLSGARTDAAQTVGALRTVTADPVLGGLPTHGWTTSLQIGADGALTMGYGRLSALTAGDSYPVVDAAAALKELNAQPVMHPDLCVAPLPQPQVQKNQGAASGTGDDKGGKPGTGTVTTAAPPNLRDTRPCAPITPHKVQVRGATFGLSMQFVSGTQTLVPAWLFDTAQAGVARTAVVAQTAVDPSYITTGGSGGPGANAPGGPSPVSPATPANPGGPERVNPGGPERVDPGQPADPKAPHAVDLVQYKAAGRTLTLTFWGGVCPGYQASAQESGTEVKVRVTETPATAGKMCPMILRQLTRTVTLAQPLGTRTVVDTSDGQPIKGQ